MRGTTLGQKSLTGLSGYMLSDFSAPPEPTSSSKKNAKKKRPGTVEEVFNKEGAPGRNIGVFTVSPASVLVRPLAPSVDMCLFMTLLLVVNFVVGELTTNFLDYPAPEVLVPALAALAAGQAMRGLMRALADGATPPAERQLSFFVGVLSFIAALVTITFAPPNVIKLNVRQCMIEAEAGWKAFNDRRGLEKHEKLNMMRGHIEVPLAVLGGLLSGIVCAPAVRWTRSFVLATEPPVWFTTIIAVGKVKRGLMTLALVLPWVLSFLFVPILGEDLFQWAPENGEIVRGVLLILTGCLHMSMLRPLSQGFLDSALVTWFELRHAAKLNAALVISVMKHKFTSTSHLLCKVAVQLLAPGVLMISMGAVMLSRRSGYDAQRALGPPPLVPPTLYRAGAGFLGWWICVTWSITTIVTLAMFRVGLLKT